MTLRMTPIVDCHTHTRHSDGIPEVEDNVRAAIAAGCETIVSTDHLTCPESMDPGSVTGVPEADLKSLAEDVEAARLAHPEIEVVFGFECDWYEGCEANVRRWSAGATFLLGSVHWVADGWIDDPNDLSVWKRLGPDEVWRQYVDAWCKACESEVGFDSMAHPDLPWRFANEGFAPTIDLAPLFDEMAACAHETHRHVEVSTAGLRKSVGSYYPCPELLHRFRNAEVPVTVGSDAHRAEDVCWGIRDAYDYAAASGYSSIDVPRVGGGWRTIEL